MIDEAHLTKVKSRMPRCLPAFNCLGIQQAEALQRTDYITAIGGIHIFKASDKIRCSAIERTSRRQTEIFGMRIACTYK